MKPNEIGEELVAVHTALVEKLGKQPWTAPNMDIDNSGRCRIVIYGDRVTRPDSHRLGEVKADTFKGCIDEAFKFIAALPSAEDAAKHRFHGNLGKLIDEGREIGIETEFMNPLEATMKSLSENILTDQRT